MRASHPTVGLRTFRARVRPEKCMIYGSVYDGLQKIYGNPAEVTNTQALDQTEVHTCRKLTRGPQKSR
jgi:hypothetical protein